jgi:hypothetical protein
VTWITPTAPYLLNERPPWERLLWRDQEVGLVLCQDGQLARVEVLADEYWTPTASSVSLEEAIEQFELHRILAGLEREVPEPAKDLVRIERVIHGMA